MRRPAYLAAFVLVLALPLCQAQRGGGFHGSMAPAGFSRPAMSRPAMARPATSAAYPAFRHIPAPRGPYWGGMHAPPHFGSNPAFNHAHNHIHIRTYPWWGYGYGGYYGYPWYYGGYYYPMFWDWTSSSSYDDSAQQDYQRQVMRQIDDLSQEVQHLREQRDIAESQPPSPPRPAPAPQPHAEAPAKPDLPTILVYPDKHIEEVKNYAVVGETLWIFGDRIKKIPLMDIDLAATSKLNDERGVYFEVPGRVPSQ